MSEAKKEMTRQETKATVKREAAQKETMIYMGPTIQNVVVTGTLFNNGLPGRLLQEMERQPVIGSLIVPVSRAAETQKELAVPGSALATIYEKIDVRA